VDVQGKRALNTGSYRSVYASDDRRHVRPGTTRSKCDGANDRQYAAQAQRRRLLRRALHYKKIASASEKFQMGEYDKFAGGTLGSAQPNISSGIALGKMADLDKKKHSFSPKTMRPPSSSAMLGSTPRALAQEARIGSNAAS